MRSSNKIRVETLGCRLNQIESESIAGIFADSGFSILTDSLSAKSRVDFDVKIAILNTCAVTQKSEQKARRIIRLMLEKFPLSLIIATGCYAQLSGEQILKINDRIFVVAGQIKSRISEIPSILCDFLRQNEWNAASFKNKLSDLISAPQQKKFFPENSFKLSANSFFAHSRASLKIQDGCDNNCSYCAIRVARGRSVSLDVKTALERVIELENKGYDEVVLTTVNVAQYRGAYNDDFLNFAQLLKILLEKTQKIHFRISSLYPEIVDEDFCKIISDSRVQPHFHLSVQSGSDKILKLMNRKYDSESVIKACDALKKSKNLPFIACDIIVGFPGETEDDFKATENLLKKCDFSWVHVFAFSERPGTPAAQLKNKIPQSVAKERVKQLSQWAVNQKIKYCEQFVGKKLPAILETVKRPVAVSKNNAEFVYHAVTENFLHCRIESKNQFAPSKKIEVKIEKVLSENIKKGGDLEVFAKIIEKNT